MARTRADMQRLIDQRDQLLREIEALRNKVAGVEMAIALLDGDRASASGKRPSKSVKALLLEMLKEVGTTGLNAAIAVDMANRRGITLNLGSASSTLSRFKTDAVITHGADGRYRLPQFTQDDLPLQNVRPLRWGANS